MLYLLRGITIARACQAICSVYYYMLSSVLPVRVFPYYIIHRKWEVIMNSLLCAIISHLCLQNGICINNYK